MDLSLLDKSSGVTPILVRLYDSHKLYGLAKDKEPGARAELTSAVSALLEMKLSPREGELVADVLMSLMRQTEKDLRVAISEKLSVTDNVPLRLILQISNDEIDVAAPILRNSTVLGELDLAYIIKSKSAEYWREIASRKMLSDYVMNMLADTKDFDTAMALAKNMSVKLSEHVLVVLSDLAQKSEAIAAPLLRRDEMTIDIAKKLYEFVGQELKRYIAENFKEGGKVAKDAIDDIVLELVEATGETDYRPTPTTIKTAERFQEKGLLTIKMMITTLKRGQVQTFIAMFSKFSGLDSDTILSILRQPNGQGIAVVCRAFDVEKQDFISLYLLSNRIRNGSRMADLKDISRAITYFDKIHPEIAKGILQNSLGELK